MLDRCGCDAENSPLAVRIAMGLFFVCRSEVDIKVFILRANRHNKGSFENE